MLRRKLLSGADGRGGGWELLDAGLLTRRAIGASPGSGERGGGALRKGETVDVFPIEGLRARRAPMDLRGVEVRLQEVNPPHPESPKLVILLFGSKYVI